MLRDLESSQRSTARLSSVRRLPLVLCLSLGLLATAPVPRQPRRAAEQLVEPVAVRLNINLGDHTLCANGDYPVSVTPVIIAGTMETDPFSGKERAVDTPIEAVAVEAFSQNPGVATVSPRRQVSGWDVEGGAVHAALFTLHASKPGSTRVYFETMIRGNYLGPGVDIKVVNCKYKITIKGRAAGSGDNIFLTQVYTATGEIGGDPTSALTGDAQVTWQMRQAGDCYASTISTPPSIARLKGTLSGDGDTLTVNVTFNPLTVSNTVRMAGLCARSGATSTQQGQIQPPPLVFTVSGAGGSDSLPFVFSDGAVTLTGTATIRAVPLASQ